MIELRELWVCRHIEFFSYVECINSGRKFFFVMEGEIVTHGVLTLRKKKMVYSLVLCILDMSKLR